MALILDTSVVYAALDRGDDDHRSCRELIDGFDELRVVPSPTLPEIDYLVARRLGAGAMLAFLRDLRDEVFVVEDLEHEDYERVIEIVDRFADSGVGFVDAAVFAVTERYGEPKLATLDRRHFPILRPRHVDSLQLLPS